MADILLISVREEDKDDFTIELIRGLMSRGLTVSYTGAFYCERKDQYVYDNVTNLLFFASTYFREAQMKFTNFTTREGFLDNIDYEQIDAKLVIYVSTREIVLKNIEEKFNDYLKSKLKGLIVELIRNSFEMSFSDFESHYPEIVEILGIEWTNLRESRRQIEEYKHSLEAQWEKYEIYPFIKFMSICRQAREEIWREESITGKDIKRFDRLEKRLENMFPENGEPKEENLQKIRETQRDCAKLENKIMKMKGISEKTRNALEKSQRDVEKEIFRFSSEFEKLFDNFFESYVIERALENPERAMFFQISSRIPQREVLCLYYEEEDNKEKRLYLYFYPEKYTVWGEKVDMKGETGDTMDEEEDTRRTLGIGLSPPPRLPILRNGILLKRPRDLYSSEKIKEIIDKHVLLALHPPLVNVLFPINDLVLEVDPEEPEIGFMSRKVNLSNCQTIEESLRIDTELREKLRIYRWKKEKNRTKNGKFTEIRIGDRKESEEEDILILSRIENLYRVLLGSSKFGRYYRPMFTLLKLAVLIFLIILTWKILQPPADARQVFPTAIVSLSGAVFIFWALKIFVLNYLLDPMYDILKWISYFLLLIILCFSKESLEVLVAFFLFTIPVIGIVSFNPYILSAILYSLNDLFEIMDYNDRLKTEGLSITDGEGILEVLRCGRYQTIVRDNNEVKVFFNSLLFPKIKYIHKKIRTSPRLIAYSSGILLSSEDEEKPEADIKKQLKEELIYKKPRTWRFWRTMKSLIFGKGRIEYTNNLDDRSSPNNRFIYFGDWNYVMKNIGTAIPVFPESVLFRNMIILAVLSGLIFNIFPENGIHLENFLNWIGNMGLWHVITYLVIPFIWILVATELRIQFWKVSIVLVFYYLLIFQPFSIEFSIIILILSILFAVLVYFRFSFPINQVCYSFRIWWNERWNGDIVSVRNKNKSSERGTRIRKNLIVTRLFMSGEDCVEEERIYFNEQFFKDIVENDKEWDKIRENQELENPIKKKKEEGH